MYVLLLLLFIRLSKTIASRHAISEVVARPPHASGADDHYVRQVLDTNIVGFLRTIKQARIRMKLPVTPGS